jgi:hypothetical protein
MMMMGVGCTLDSGEGTRTRGVAIMMMMFS